MRAEQSDTTQSLAEFDSRHTREGLLLRYARGRLSSFWKRQALTLSGAVLLFFLVSPEVGLLACTLAIAGEVLDCVLLAAIPTLLTRGITVRCLYRWTTVTGGLQALTIAACVALAWFTAPNDSASLFSLAYLTGAGINAGIVLPFHPAATKVRLCIFAGTVVALFAHAAFLITPQNEQDQLIALTYDALGSCMMMYMASIFVEFVAAGHQRQQANRRELLVRSQALAQALAELRENQKEARKLSLVARHAMDSVIMSDPQGRVQWVNETFSRVTGYDFEEIRGKRPSEVLNGPETSQDTADSIAAAISAGTPHRAEILNYRKDGKKIWMETMLVPVLQEDGNTEMVVAIERDVTASKQHAAELAQAKIAAEDGARAKSSFLATMSHEIRTPMNGVIGMADLLCEAPLSPEHHSYAATIRTSAEALLTIINDILDLSKLDAGRVELCQVDFNLRTCIEDVTKLLSPQAQSKGLFLTVETCVANTLINGDDGRLRQILLNVIGNAIKFTESGGVHVTTTEHETDAGPLVMITVLDSGIGIPADRLERVFDQFSQADAATTRRFGGTGLGLTISRMLAHAMGGDIKVSSPEGQGACFTLTFPMRAASGTQTIYEPVPAILAEVAQGLVVLVAEDNKTNRLLVRKYLQDAPVSLFFAHDGHQAVEMTQTHQPDIIFMDMSMPGMDGLAATRAIRRECRRQPRIVALTANGFASDRQACLDAGMNDFLAKPVRKAQLLECLALVHPAL
ncbi:PAS domain-containing hybrid sensor histidine kinase/response regulator [Thalassovita taeanensis]|uniref:Sensory/regulatory protein RpfC n=1 Tax=Thalassovita taeanensis TaxID=657014 RepID=A0A1H9DX94_9RHOB|nr:ATP-binding protein [Thalassovita taeanensis]SEQ18074.1 PAS/PAC sensor hybrid histidine kinase [Thalassovita taeanensis]